MYQKKFAKKTESNNSAARLGSCSKHGPTTMVELERGKRKEDHRVVEREERETEREREREREREEGKRERRGRERQRERI